jgi:cystathionine gamma-synthase
VSNKPRQLPPKVALSTRAVHAGEAAHKAYDAITTPIVNTATYVFADTSALRDHFEGRVEREEYGRYGNPTVRIAERKIAALDEAEDAVVFSSGMAAATTTLLGLLKAGDHIVMTSDCYRRTRQFILTFLSRYGITSTLVEPDDLSALEAALIPGKTKVILSETPTNPYMRVVDLARLADIKRRFGGAKLVIDATFATPVNLRPLALGADLVIHSGTKYLGGHNDLMAGVVCGNEGLVSAIRDLRGILGAVLDANSAYLLLRGIKTLSLRVGRQNESSLRIARWLEEQPQVERVFYPGLPSHPDHTIAKAQMAGFGGVVSFFFKGDLDATSRFIDACRIAQIAPSLGGVETLIEQPALMSFYELDTAQREAIGIRNNLVRMAVGVEDCDDLIADLAQAFAAASKTR